MNGSSLTGNDTDSAAASVAAILGVKGTLRFRPHGATQKAHVVLRRVVVDESQNLIRFKLFAAKKIDVKPGKEILLAVASEDGRFKDLPIILEGDILDIQTDTDEEDETQVADEEEDHYIPPSEAIIPPKLRRDWMKRTEDIVHIPPPLTYSSAGVQAEPLHVSAAIQVGQRNTSIFTQTECQSVSSSTQTENSSVSSSMQTEYNLVSSSVQTEKNSISSSIQTENNSVATSMQTENNSASVSMQTGNNSTSASMQTEDFSTSSSVQTENPCISSSVQTENIVSSCSVQTETNTASQIVQADTPSVPAAVQVYHPSPLRVTSAIQTVDHGTSVLKDIQTNNTQDAKAKLIAKKLAGVARSISSTELDSQRDVTLHSPSYINGQPCNTPGSHSTSRIPPPTTPDAPTWLSPHHEDENKSMIQSKLSPERTETAPNEPARRKHLDQGVNLSVHELTSQDPSLNDMPIDEPVLKNKINGKPFISQHPVSESISHSSSVDILSQTVPRKRTSEEQQGVASSGRSNLALHTPGVPTGPRRLLQGAPPDGSMRMSIPPDEMKSSSPPPDSRPAAHIHAGPSSNPLGIRSSITMGLKKAPPKAPRAMQACKPVAVGSEWSATRTRAPPRGPTALVSIVPKDNVPDANVPSSSVASKPTSSTTVSMLSSDSTTQTRYDVNRSTPFPPTGPSYLSHPKDFIPNNTFSADSSSPGLRREVPSVLGDVASIPSSHATPVPSPPSVPPPPSPADPMPPLPSSPPPPPRKWKKVGKEVPPPPPPPALAPILTPPAQIEATHQAGFQHKNPLEQLSHSYEPTEQLKSDLFGHQSTHTVDSTARPSQTPEPCSDEPPLKKPKIWNESKRLKGRLSHKQPPQDLPPPEPPSTPTAMPTPTSSSLPSLPQPLNHPLPPKPVQPLGHPPTSKRAAKRVRRFSSEPNERPPKRKRSFKWPTIETSNVVSLQGDGDTAIRTVIFSTDGSHFAVTCADCSLRIWNSKNRNEIARLTRDSMILGVAWMDGGSGVVIFTEDGTVGKYNRQGSAWQWTKLLDVGMEDYSDEEPVCFAYMRDRIAVSFPHSGVKVWLWQKGVWCTQRSIVRRSVSVIRFVDGGDTIVGGTKDGVLWCCEVPGGTLRACAFLKTRIVSLDVDPSGTQVLVGEKAGLARLFPLRQSTVKDAETTYTCEEITGGESCSIPALFATKGQAILYGNVDECILVWDKRKAVVVYGLEHPEDDRVRTVACFDGNASRPGFIITGTRQGQLCWWPLPISS